MSDVTLISAGGVTVFRGKQAGGGSQTVKSVVCPVVTADDVQDGPISLYDTQAGESVVAMYVASFVPVADSGGIAVGVDGAQGDPNLLLGGVDTSTAYDSGFYAAHAITTPLPAVSDPLVIGASGDIASQSTSFARPWAAATFYGAGNLDLYCIIEDGRLWINSGNEGISGNVKPDFSSAPGGGGTVADGADIVWEDEGNFSAGSLAVILLVAIAS